MDPQEVVSSSILEDLVLRFGRVLRAELIFCKRKIFAPFGCPRSRSTVFTGGHHDLIAIDPRGTANTLTFKCYANDTERASSGGVSNACIANSSDVALGAMWVTGKIFADDCYENRDSRKNGELIGTAFTARDMMQVVDALDEDGLLRYWGLSYGTALGATAAAMFPDRIDKMILDGVLNPHDFYHGT